MDSFPWLSAIIFTPLIGVFFILLIKGERETISRNSRAVALWTSLVTFFVSLGLWFNFDNNTPEFQFKEKYVWVDNLDLAYHLGIIDYY